MPPSIVIDSASSDIVYVGPQWQNGSDTSTFSGTYYTCRTDMNDTAITPTMIFSFQGTGVSFYGQPTDNLKLNYTFDGSRSRVAETNFTRGIPGKTGVRLWGVENIAATIHSVTLIPTAGQPILDYIVVTPFDYASLSEKILALDDTDSVIKYSGSWTSKSGDTLSGGLAYNDTRHGSTQAGDNFTISFTGQSISVYGLLNQKPGRHSSTYSIDGGPPATYDYSFETSDPVQPDTWLLHQKFFSKEVIPGQHNLTVNIDEVSGSQVFWLDYILFEGTSSTTLSPKPTASPTPAKKSGLSKAIENVIIGVVVVVVVFFIINSFFGRRFSRWFKEYREDPPSRLQTPPAMPPLVSPAFMSHRDNDYETRRLRIEMENLRRENERIRVQAQESSQGAPVPTQPQPHSHQTPQQTPQPPQHAGPADSPPPYSFIP